MPNNTRNPPAQTAHFVASAELIAALRQYAKQHSTTMQDVVIEAIKQYIQPKEIRIMARNHTYQDVANSFDLWGEYVDPDATMTEQEFDEMSIAERVAIQVQCFGKEQSDWQNSNEHGEWLSEQTRKA